MLLAGNAPAASSCAMQSAVSTWKVHTVYKHVPAGELRDELGVPAVGDVVKGLDSTGMTLR
jgi:hypothetical protein